MSIVIRIIRGDNYNLRCLDKGLIPLQLKLSLKLIICYISMPVPPILLRAAVGSTKLIGQLHWALFIVIQSCYPSFLFWFICLLVYRNLILTISARMKTSAQFKFALYSKTWLKRTCSKADTWLRRTKT